MSDFAVDLSDVYKGMASMGKRIGSLSSTFRQLRGPLRDEQKAHDREAMGPDGQWAPRAATTARRRLVDNRRHRKANVAIKAARVIALGKIKIKRRNLVAKKLLGRLPGAVTYTVRATSLTAESRVPWSMAQQAGARVGRHLRTTLLPRPFLWMSNGLQDRAASAINAAVAQAWGRDA